MLLIQVKLTSSFFFLENTFYLKQNKRKKHYYNENQTNLIFNEVIEFNRIRFKKQIIFWLLKKNQCLKYPKIIFILNLFVFIVFEGLKY